MTMVHLAAATRCAQGRVEQAAPTRASAVLPLWVYDNVKESAVMPFYEPAV